MQPTTMRYDFSYKYMPSFCGRPKYLCGQAVNNSVCADSMLAKLRADTRFSKTVELINKAGLQGMLDQDNHMTLFVTEDSHIPDAFVQQADRYTAWVFIRSYLLPGTVGVEYFKANGSSVYTPYFDKNPLLVIVSDRGDMFVNEVGKVQAQISAINGSIIVCDNIAQVTYI